MLFQHFAFYKYFIQLFQLQELWRICPHPHQNLLSTATNAKLPTFPLLQMIFLHHLHQSVQVIQNFGEPHTNPIINQNMAHMDLLHR
jgi:hypothetical protein